MQESFSRKIGSLFVHPATIGGFHTFIVISSIDEDTVSNARILYKYQITKYGFGSNTEIDAWKQAYP